VIRDQARYALQTGEDENGVAEVMESTLTGVPFPVYDKKSHVADIAHVAFKMIDGPMIPAKAPENPLHHPEQEEPVAISNKDQQEIEVLYDALRKGKAKLVGPTGEAQPLPDSLYLFLVALIGRLNEGKSVYIIQNQAQLTTIEAASIIGVSRQFLVGLLEKNEIPYHMVGTHRRIYAQDLVHYKVKRDQNRKRVIDDLAEHEAAEGLYGRERSPSADAD